ncbi:MAG: hypothetical protein SO253_03780 [Bacilli bacterium]|nr:hypothetical protein [Bacilli bacterium]
METLNKMLEDLINKGSYFVDEDNKIVLTREHLGETLAGNYEASIMALQDGNLLKAFKACDLDAYNYLNELQSKDLDLSLVLFHLQYFLNKNLPLSFKETVFKDLKSFGQLLFDNRIDDYIIEEILKNQITSKYLKIKGIDEVSKVMFDNIVLAENLVNEQFEVAKKLVAYALLEKEDYTYASKKFNSIEELYDFLLQKKKLMRFSKTFKEDYNFMAWIIYLGKYDLVKLWSERIQYFD